LILSPSSPILPLFLLHNYYYFNFRIASPPRGARLGGADFRVLSDGEVADEQTRVVNDVSSLLEIPVEAAQALLVHFRWSREALLDRYYVNPAAERAAAGAKFGGTMSVSTVPFMCEICLIDFPAGPISKPSGLALGCSHIFCRDCWASYLDTMLSVNGANCVSTRCPERGCGECIPIGAVSVLAAPDVALKWRNFGIKHFVAVSKNMTLCPAPSCSAAFLVKPGASYIKCPPCGYQFCHKCSREAHAPVSCIRLDLWLEKCGNESETANWILLNTKKCPKCAARIEKNQGCNHIKCSNKGCRHEFCWTCLGPWVEHGQTTGGFYKCNKYSRAVEPVVGAKVDDAARAKVSHCAAVVSYDITCYGCESTKILRE
jgi:ariadne-1